jgi:hypothetical protein
MAPEKRYPIWQSSIFANRDDCKSTTATRVPVYSEVVWVGLGSVSLYTEHIARTCALTLRRFESQAFLETFRLS